MKKIVVSRARAYEVIRKPIITEKATYASEHNQVVFQVARDASKPEIRAAVEQLFKVKVKKVNTLRQAGKVKRFIEAWHCKKNIAQRFCSQRPFETNWPDINLTQ